MQQGRDLYEIADHYAKALPLVPTDKLLSLCTLFLKVAKNAKIGMFIQINNKKMHIIYFLY